MRLITKLLPFSLLAVLYILVFRNWFSSSLIAGGDFQIYYPEMLHDLSKFPSAWNWTLRTGLGSNGAGVLWNYVAVSIPITILNSFLHFDWQVVQRVGYLYPFLTLVLISPYVFFRKIFGIPWGFLSVFIFCFNTYVLMLTGGGQIFLSLAYALIPLVFLSFYKLVKFDSNLLNERVIYIISATLTFSLQLLFDVRIAYVTLAIIGIFISSSVLFLRTNFRNLLYLPLVFAGTAAVHAFWILPVLLLKQNPLAALGTEFVSVGIVDFFSFAKFENTISLLHPNWPENIFGKTYFMKPEFLILPILAFSSLLFIKKEKEEIKELVVFFAISALVCAFFAKGTTDPFGKIYSWMFINIPGFVIFRDPTKWYAGIAFSYAFLVPFAVKKIYERIKAFHQRTKIVSANASNIVSKVFVSAIVLYLLFLIRPALVEELGGIFRTTQVPFEYLKLRQFIVAQPGYFRTIWVPHSSKYSFYSSNYSLISGTSIFGNYSLNDITKELSKDSSKTALKEASVKYVIVPSDPDGVIFLTEREYDEKKYLKTVSDIRKIQYLKKIEGFGKIGVFEVPDPRGHFFRERENLAVSYSRQSPSEYKVQIKNAIKGERIIFSEGFDSNWEASNPGIGFSDRSSAYNKHFNSFTLPKDGDYDIRIYYKPQDLVKFGTAISLSSAIVIVTTLLYFIFKPRNGRTRQ